MLRPPWPMIVIWPRPLGVLVVPRRTAIRIGGAQDETSIFCEEVFRNTDAPAGAQQIRLTCRAGFKWGGRPMPHAGLARFACSDANRHGTQSSVPTPPRSAYQVCASGGSGWGRGTCSGLSRGRCRSCTALSGRRPTPARRGRAGWRRARKAGGSAARRFAWLVQGQEGEPLAKHGLLQGLGFRVEIEGHPLGSLKQEAVPCAPVEVTWRGWPSPYVQRDCAPFTVFLGTMKWGPNTALSVLPCLADDARAQESELHRKRR